jgi:hypothetical protein
MVYKLDATGVTISSHAGLVGSNNQTALAFSAGRLYASQGDVIDVSDPSDPLPVGRIPFIQCTLALRSPQRLFMLCPAPALDASGPILRVFDTGTLAQTGSATLPPSFIGTGPQMFDLAYIGGDAIAFLTPQLQIVHAPIVASPP